MCLFVILFYFLQLQIVTTGLTVASYGPSPPEIWAEIFMQCLPDNQFVKLCPCSWRRYAVDGNQSRCPQDSEILFSIKHSRFVLHLWFTPGCLVLEPCRCLSISKNASQITCRAWTTLLNFLSWWSHLGVSAELHIIWRLVFDPNVTMPILKTLVFHVSEPCNSFMITSSLCSIKIGGFFVNPHVHVLPWSQLTEFKTFSPIYTNHCFLIFQLSKSNKDFHLQSL